MFVSAVIDAANQEVTEALANGQSSTSCQSRRKRSVGFCTLKRIDYDSITISKDHISVDVYVDDGSATQRRRITIDTSDMPAYKRLLSTLEDAQRRILTTDADNDATTAKVSRIVGGAGLFMGISGTINAIDDGDRKDIIESSITTS